MSTSGKFLTVEGAGAEVTDNYAWNVKDGVKPLDRTTGANGGFGDVDAGVRRADITIRAWIDTELAANVSNFQPGDVIEDLNLFYVRGDATPAYAFPVVLCVDNDVGGEVDGQFLWNATFKNKGEYTFSTPAG